MFSEISIWYTALAPATRSPATIRSMASYAAGSSCRVPRASHKSWVPSRKKPDLRSGPRTWSRARIR